MQPPSREKGLFDMVVDFVFGALGGLLLSWFLSEPRGRSGPALWKLHFTSSGWYLYYLGGCLIAGALTSLYRDRMSEPTLLSNIPRDPSFASGLVLWLIAIGGGCFIGLAFLQFMQH